MALSYSVHEGDTGVGKLGNGSYFVVAEDPGPHVFTMNGEVTDTLHLEVDAGETQYVQQTLGVGIMSARPHITPSDKMTFDGMPKLSLSDKKPTDLKPSGEIAPTHLSKAAAGRCSGGPRRRRACKNGRRTANPRP